MNESVKVQQHAIEYIRESAGYYERVAFQRLQFSECEREQLMLAERMELWKSVQILIEQRDNLQKYIRLLIITDGEVTTAKAAREYLEGIGIAL